MEQENNPQANIGPAIMINNQYIKDLSLEIPHAPEIFSELTSAPDVSIDVDIKSKHLGENNFNVELKLAVNGNIGEKPLFILELTYGASVVISVPAEHLEPVLLIEVPRMLFPFARAIVTNSLMEAGLPPFMINPIDFVTMYQNRTATKN